MGNKTSNSESVGERRDWRRLGIGTKAWVDLCRMSGICRGGVVEQKQVGTSLEEGTHRLARHPLQGAARGGLVWSSGTRMWT